MNHLDFIAPNPTSIEIEGYKADGVDQILNNFCCEYELQQGISLSQLESFIYMSILIILKSRVTDYADTLEFYNFCNYVEDNNQLLKTMCHDNNLSMNELVEFMIQDNVTHHDFSAVLDQIILHGSNSFYTQGTFYEIITDVSFGIEWYTFIIEEDLASKCIDIVNTSAMSILMRFCNWHERALDIIPYFIVLGRNFFTGSTFKLGLGDYDDSDVYNLGQMSITMTIFKSPQMYWQMEHEEDHLVPFQNYLTEKKASDLIDRYGVPLHQTQVEGDHLTGGQTLSERIYRNIHESSWVGYPCYCIDFDAFESLIEVLEYQ